jgi:hypothetical protein
MTPQKRHCLDALLSTLAGTQWQSKGAALATPALSPPTSLSRRSRRWPPLPSPREENMLGKKKFESRAGQGKRRMPGMVVKEKATAQRRKAPAHPRVALDSHESCVCPPLCSGGPAASCRQERLALGMWLEPASRCW